MAIRRSVPIAGLFLWLFAVAPAMAQPVSFGYVGSYSVGGAPVATAVSDFNGDSDPDLAVANSGSSNVSVLLGSAGAAFSGPTSFPTALLPAAVAAGNFNGDSNPDLAVGDGDFGQTALAILLGNGSGGFGAATHFNVGPDPRGIAVGDFNGDSRDDVATANLSGNSVSILLGNGSGGFTGPTDFSVGSSPQAIVAGYLNGDSRLDLAVAASGSSQVSVLLGNGTGGFSGPTNTTTSIDPVAIAIGDFNADGKRDLATANYSANDATVLLGNGTGGFASPISLGTGGDTHPRSIAVGDLNSDSHLDVVVETWSTGQAAVFLGNGSGGFTGPSNFSAGSLGVAIADFDADSRPDLAALTYSPGMLNLLVNTTPPLHDAPALADSLHVALVPNFRQSIGATQCGATGGTSSTHGAPLALQSCNPPAFLPAAQAHAGSQFTGATDITVIPGDANPGNGNQADVALSVTGVDVRQGSAGGADYNPVAAGSDMTALAKIRISDQYNSTSAQTCAPTTECAATVNDVDFTVPVVCVATPDPSVGSGCNANTTANAVVPGVAKESKRSAIQVFRLRLKDAGGNGTPGDADDGEAFMQGIYVR